MNRSICQIPTCYSYGKYCRLHATGSLKEKKPIAPRSKKLESVMRKDYRPQVKEMIAANTPCKVKSPVCSKVAQGFHHLQGRGKNLMKKKIPCCNLCNQYVEQNDLWARNNGFKLSKFSKA